MSTQYKLLRNTDSLKKPFRKPISQNIPRVAKLVGYDVYRENRVNNDDDVFIGHTLSLNTVAAMLLSAYTKFNSGYAIATYDNGTELRIDLAMILTA